MFKEFTLNEVAKILHTRVENMGLELVRGISIDSRTTKPGDIFFALKGEKTDGHFYTKEAQTRGALGIIVQKKMAIDKEILVPDTLFALGEFARVYRSNFNPKTIGITGTNGKTTVKNLISAILQKKYHVLASKKNFNSLIGLPLTIFNLSGKENYLVLEMGTSKKGEIKRLCEIGKPSIGIITNIGPGHIQGFGSIEEVKKEKLSLIEALPDDGFGIVGEGVVGINIEKDIFSFSLNMLEDLQLGEDGSWFTYQGKRFYTRLLGLSNVYNCLAALVLTSKIGLDAETQKLALAEIKPEPGRLEPIRHNGLLIINDTYNANPVSMHSAIDFTKTLKRRKIFVLGDMLELGGESNKYHIELGKYANEHCEMILTLGNEARYYKGKHFKDKDGLVNYLIRNLNGDEAILVKASRALRFEEIVDELLRRY